MSLKINSFTDIDKIKLGYDPSDIAVAYRLQGRFWYFTTLTGKDYCVSKPVDVTDPDVLLQIVFILRKLKELILGGTLLAR